MKRTPRLAKESAGSRRRTEPFQKPKHENLLRKKERNIPGHNVCRVCPSVQEQFAPRAPRTRAMRYQPLSKSEIEFASDQRHTARAHRSEGSLLTTGNAKAIYLQTGSTGLLEMM